MTVTSRQTIRAFGGKIIGYLETDKKGNQQARSFWGTIVAKYDKDFDVTRDFYGKILTKGNTCAGQLFNPEINKDINR